jgi:hypothetical protein
MFSGMGQNQVYEYSQILQKQLKKQVEEGAIKHKFIESSIGKLLLKPNAQFNIDTLFDQYKLNQVFFKKNPKTVCVNTESLDNKKNLWGFVGKNNVVRLYPNTTRAVLSSNLLGLANDTTEDSVTNGIATTNLD